MDGAKLGMIGGIAGAVIGLAGGIIGTYYSISRARGEVARSFIIRCSIVGWILGLAFVAALLLLPSPWRFLVWIPYGVVFPLSLTYVNRRMAELDQQEKE